MASGSKKKKKVSKAKLKKLASFKGKKSAGKSWFKEKFQSAGKMAGRTYQNRWEDTTKICQPR